MDRVSLQERIVSCIWSKDQREFISKTGHVFQDEELVSIAYYHANSFEERLDMLKLLKEHLPGASDLASRCIAYQIRCFERFCSVEEGTVYELRIMETPDAYVERYLCDSYQTALKMIDGFYEEYSFTPETPDVRYEIVKRKILRACDSFQEDVIQSCSLKAEKVLLDAETWGEDDDPKIELCDVRFPVFCADYVPVLYRMGDGSVHKGIFLGTKEAAAEALMIIPMECSVICDRNYGDYEGFIPHEHIAGANVALLSKDGMTDREWEDFDSFLRYWKARIEAVDKAAE